MKGGLYIAAAPILGALLANLLLADPGYVALRFAGRLVEMSAVTFLLLLVAAYFAVRLVARAISARQLVETQSGATPARTRAPQSRPRAAGAFRRRIGSGREDAHALMRATRRIPSRITSSPRALPICKAGATPRRAARARARSCDRSARAGADHAGRNTSQAQAAASALATLEQLEASGESNARGLLLLSRVHRQTGAVAAAAGNRAAIAQHARHPAGSRR